MESRPLPETYLTRSVDEVNNDLMALCSNGSNVKDIGMTRDGHLVTRETFERENKGYLQFLMGEITDPQGDTFQKYRERYGTFWAQSTPIEKRSVKHAPYPIEGQIDPSAQEQPGYKTPPEYSPSGTQNKPLIGANLQSGYPQKISELDSELDGAQQKYGLTAGDIRIIRNSPPTPLVPDAFRTCMDAWRRVRMLPNHSLTFTRFWTATQRSTANLETVEKIIHGFEHNQSTEIEEGSTTLIKTWLAQRPYPGLDRPENMGLSQVGRSYLSLLPDFQIQIFKVVIATSLVDNTFDHTVKGLNFCTGYSVLTV